MTDTEIVHGKKGCDVWIDRRSKFGNPFKISDFNDNLPDSVARQLVIKLYSEYFDKRVRHDDEFRKAVQELEGKKLGCHCKPKDCHGDVIKRYLDGQIYQNGRWWIKPNGFTHEDGGDQDAE